MSKNSRKQCGHTAPDDTFEDPRPRPKMPMAYESSLRHKSCQFVSPDVGHNHMIAAPQPRSPQLGALPDVAIDRRYIISSDHGHIYRGFRLRTVSSRMHLQGLPRGPAALEKRSSSMLSQSHEPVTHRIQTYDQEYQHSGICPDMPSPVFSEKSSLSHPKEATVSQEPKPATRKRVFGIPRGFEELLHFEPESSTSPPSPHPDSSQIPYHLYVRQQPIAARACGTGDRDRRTVDPPPIVQILLTDFDPDSQDDRKVLEDPRFTVGCLLFPVSDSPSHLPNTDGEQHQEEGESDGVARTENEFCTPLLYGKTFMSPFFVDADPDPNSAPTHPSSDSQYRVPSHNLLQLENSNNASKLHQPATFFIFADLSIRLAGLYRLQFRLMNWGSVEDTGQSMPILAESWSDAFRVYPAKEFPGMRESSILADGLKELGFAELKTRRKPEGKDRKF